MAAAPNNDAGSMAMPVDSVNLESSIASDLNGSYEIRNPYAESAEESFTIAAKMAAPLATRVSCGGRTWTHGELLGHTGDGQPVYTRITDNRIYLNWNGRVPDNIWILYHLQEGTFPVNGSNDALINGCVNPVDPSTAPVNLLGTNGSQITCNGVTMPDGNRLGVFVGSTGNTYQFIKYVNGLLRVMIKQGENDTRTDNYYMGLLVETIQGKDGSYLDQQWRGVLTAEMVNGCFWPTAPKTATPLPDNNCASGPAISNVSNISQTALTVSFTGSGVTSLKWRIKSSGTEVRSGTTGDFGSATSTNISYSSLAPGNYTLEIEGNNCSSAVSSRAFTINEPVVVVPDCQNGPSVTSVTSITPSSATINFGGTNLHVFSWRILDGSNYAVASGKTGTLTTNSTNLAFNYLQNGTYTFELKAEDCKAAAVATRSFSVSATDTRTACTRGPVLQSIVSSGETSLQFLFDGENVFAIDWKVKKDGVVIRQNRVSPTSNTPTINYNTLANGAYILEIQGGSCKSTPAATAFGVNVALPIYISNFEGKTVDKGVELTWNVVEEKDGKEFEVLRYDDRMQNEEILGKVALTDQRIGKYTFLDANPLIGTNYYQLKQIDIDGTYTRSKIVAVNPGIISGTVIAPNPAQDYVNVQFTSRTAGTSEVTIYNIAGQPVSSSSIRIVEGKNNHRLNVKKLGGGHYFVKINHGGEATKLRFIKAE